MASYPPPQNDWRTQRQILRDQTRVQRDYVRSLRRSSVAGPIVAILLGVVFLLVQLGKLSSLGVLTFFAHWWPLLLVLVGVIRLLEWTLDLGLRREALRSGAPYVPRSSGAGLSFLVIMIVLGGAAVALVHQNGGQILGHAFQLNQDNLDEFLGQKHESDHTVTAEAPAGSVLSLANPRGNISIAGTSDDGQIHIQAHNEIYTRSDADAAHKAVELTPQVDHSGNQIEVSLPVIQGGRTDLNVTLPMATVLNLRADHGAIHINSMRAPVSVTANHGDVDLSAITGPVSAHINNGDSSFSAHSVTGILNVEGRALDITLSDIHGTVGMSGEFFGTVHMERVSDAVRFHTSRVDFQLARLAGELEISPNADISADQLVGPVILNTRNRNITLERVAGDLAVTNRNGSVTITAAPPLGNIAVENRNGEIDLTMPSDSSFEVQAETVNADINNDFDLPVTDEDSRPKISGTVGKGGPRVRLSTSQSDISLHRGDVVPVPPQPPEPPLTYTPSNTADEPQEQTAKQAIQKARQEADAARREAEKTRRKAEQSAPHESGLSNNF